MTADLGQTMRLPRLASVDAQLASLERTARQVAADRDAERERANAALERVAELERDLVAERAARRGADARARRAEEANRLLRLAPTLQIPRYVKPAAAPRRRRLGRRR